MPFVDLPLTGGVVQAVEAAWAISVDAEAPRLHGGEESATFRSGPYVLRIGPLWKTSEELEWCHEIAAVAAETVPEAVAPIRAADGTTVVRAEGRPVSLWPFVEGAWADDDDQDQFVQAADLLARLHLSLAQEAERFRPRPHGAGPATSVVHHQDRSLEHWLRTFETKVSFRQPLHGDFYAGNMLVSNGRIVGLLDWDDALLGPPERELAWAAWEWGDGLWADDFDKVHEFVALYRSSGGPARLLDDTSLRHLVRERLVGELAYVARTRELGEILDEHDLEYHARQQEMLRRLRR